eukprot:1064484-Rhodomonas_salina.1
MPSDSSDTYLAAISSDLLRLRAICCDFVSDFLLLHRWWGTCTSATDVLGLVLLLSGSFPACESLFLSLCGKAV